MFQRLRLAAAIGKFIVNSNARDSFVHLHLHTEYSLLDGAIRIKELMKKAVELKMPAVAMTDHGTYGAIVSEAQRRRQTDHRVRSADIAPRSHKDRPNSMRESAHHSPCSRARGGYHNLVKLFRPRISMDFITGRGSIRNFAQHSAGLTGSAVVWRAK
jgi:DNA polymerase-3 subunit alpha